MLHSIKNREDWENLNKLVSLKNQVDELWLQDKLLKQNFHENIQNLYESLTNTTRDTSREMKKNFDWKFCWEQKSIREFKRQTFGNNEG